jgi:hypothetical protein
MKKKVPSVTDVRVSLNDGLTILDLKPGNTTTLAELRQIIRNNGFISKEATVVARGRPTANQTAFAVEGTSEQLQLSSPPQRNGDDWSLAIRAPDRR